MTRLRLLVVLVLVAVIGLGIALRRPLAARLTAAVEALLERQIGAALRVPVVIDGLRLSLSPLGAEADGLRLGVDAAVGQVGAVAVRILPRTSWRQRRPVVVVSADAPTLDLPTFVRLLETLADDDGVQEPTPAFRIRLRVRQPTVVLGAGPPSYTLKLEQLAGSITVDAPLGWLRFTASGDGGELTRGDRALALTHLAARGGENATGWRLYEAALLADGVDLQGKSAGDRLHIAGRVTPARLTFLDPSLGDIGGDAEIDANLLGTLQDPTVEGTVRVAALSLAERELGEAQAQASVRREGLTVASALLRGFGGELAGNGRLEFETGLPYAAHVRWQGLDLHRLAEIDERLVKAATASGEADLEGGLEPLSVTASGNGGLTPAAGGAAVEWRGRGSYGSGAGRLEIDAAQGRNTLRGQVEIGPRDALAGSVEAAVADPPALGALLPIENVPRLQGALSLSARLSGTTGDPRLEGDLDGRNVALLGVSFERLGGAIELDRRLLRTRGLRAALWQGSVTLAGAVALDERGANDWQVRIEKVPGGDLVAFVDALTGTVLPIGRGTLDGAVAARGAWPQVQLTGELRMTELWLSQQWIHSATARATATWPRWQLDATLRNQADQPLTLRASGTSLDRLALQAHTDAWQLTSLQRGERTEMGGTLALDASVEGPPRALSGRGTLRAGGLVVSGREIGALDVAVSAQAGRWQATSDLLDGRVVLRAALSPEPGWPLSLDATWTDANFAPLLTPDVGTVVASSGTLRMRAPVADLSQIDGTARLAYLRLQSGPFSIAAVGSPEVTCRRGSCRLDRLELQGPDTQLIASGTFTVGGAVRATVDGRGDLRLLEVVGRPIESARGKWTLSAEVRRGTGGLAIDGELRLEQAGLDVGAPVAITRTSGRVAFDGVTVRILELNGNLETGTFAVGGFIDLMRGPDLTWKFVDVGAAPLPSLEVEASGAGTLTGSWERLRVAGEVTVTRMLYDRNFQLTDLLPNFNRVLAAAPRPPSARQVELDLHVVAPGELYVENNIARVEGSADLRLSGTAARPVLSGRVEVLDGEFELRRRTFDIESATADFRPDLGLAAALNISASSSIDTRDASYDVFIRVTGTTRDPRVALGSDEPGLSQTDVATLIAFGQTQSQMRESGGAFGIYDLLGMVPTGSVERTATDVLPIDRISIESVYSRNSGTFQPQLRVGRDLTDNLGLTLGQTFGVESRTLVEADYRLSPRVFVLLSWESQTETEEGAFGGGVRLRYEFWRPTPYSLLGIGALR